MSEHVSAEKCRCGHIAGVHDGPCLASKNGLYSCKCPRFTKPEPSPATLRDDGSAEGETG